MNKCVYVINDIFKNENITERNKILKRNILNIIRSQHEKEIRVMKQNDGLYSCNDLEEVAAFQYNHKQFGSDWSDSIAKE